MNVFEGVKAMKRYAFLMLIVLIVLELTNVCIAEMGWDFFSTTIDDEDREEVFNNHDDDDIIDGSDPSLFTYSTPQNGTVSITGLVERKTCPSDLIIPSKSTNGYVVNAIEKEAFKNCESLLTVLIPDSVTNIDDWAFHFCTNLETVSGASSITRIGEGTFWGCDSLSNVYLPEGLESIGSGAFYGCSSLTSISIPDSVSFIDGVAFSQCEGLKSITLPSELESIGPNMFSWCTSLTEIKLPDSMGKVLGCHAFHDCTSLKSILIPDGVTTIEYLAFYDCYNLENVFLPSSLTTIENNAFSNCVKLSEIAIPKSVDSIWDGAFSNCSSDIVFIVEQGSYADTWAKQNGFKTKYNNTRGKNDNVDYMANTFGQDAVFDSAYFAPLSKGSKGGQVVSLQRVLIALGYLNGSADGDFGKKTEAAVQSAQIQAGLPTTGVTDSLFLSELYSGIIPDVTGSSTQPVPQVVDYSETSHHTEKGGTYTVSNVFDGKTYTCWAEGISGYGIGEGISFTVVTFGRSSITLNIYSGYHKSSQRYHQNGRPKDITLYVNGEPQAYTFTDVMYPEEITVYGLAGSSFVEFAIIIDSVYNGSKWSDTCISEIEIY